MVKKSVFPLLLLIAAALMMGAMPVASLAAQEQGSTPAQQPTAKVSPSAEKAPQGMVNINTCTAAELETLPGIGPKTAEAILEQREKSGGFKSTEELKQVKGIGDKKFDKIKDRLTVQ